MVQLKGRADGGADARPLHKRDSIRGRRIAFAMWVQFHVNKQMHAVNRSQCNVKGINR